MTGAEIDLIKTWEVCLVCVSGGEKPVGRKKGVSRRGNVPAATTRNSSHGHNKIICKLPVMVMVSGLFQDWTTFYQPQFPSYCQHGANGEVVCVACWWLFWIF
jgi:hypothetical protein